MVLSLGLRDSSAHSELQVLHASPIFVCKIFRQCAYVYIFFFLIDISVTLKWSRSP